MFSFSRISTFVARSSRCYNNFMNDISLIGVPFRGGQPKRGVEEAPSFLRKYGLIARLEELGVNVQDCGDLKVLVTEDNVKRPSKLKNANECGLNAKMVAEVVAKASNENRICLTVGGDHSIAAGTVFGNAISRNRLAVVWVDAHADINTPMTTTTGNIHGMPLSQLIKGIGKSVTIEGFEWISPCLSPEDVVYIGLRDVEARERDLCEQLGIKCFYIPDIDDLGIKEVVNQTLQTINPDGDRPVHISFDIDAVDPNYAPSTGTPVVDGLTIPESLYIANAVAETGCLAGLDIVEINPRVGTKEDARRTIELAIKITEAFFGKVYHHELAKLDTQVACVKGTKL